MRRRVVAWATRDSSAGRGNRCFSVTRGTATKHCSEWAACAVARRQGAWGGEQALWGLGWAAGGPGPGTGCSGPQHVWAPQVITRCGTTRLGAGSGAPPQQASPQQVFPPTCSAPRRSPRRMWRPGLPAPWRTGRQRRHNRPSCGGALSAPPRRAWELIVTAASFSRFLFFTPHHLTPPPPPPPGPPPPPAPPASSSATC